jgi:hypothetical protein
MPGWKHVSFIYRTFVPGLLNLTSRIYLDFGGATELYLIDY